jgi:hypothetical protein
MLLLLLPACFHPTYDRPACGPQGECPSGLTCNELQVCDRGIAGPIADAAIDPPITDAPIDAPPDAPPDAQTCFGTAPFTICLRNSPSSPVIFAGLTGLDTTSSPLCAATVSGGDGYCVIAGTSITINAGISVQAVGAKPLVLLASDSITTGVVSTIDVGSHRATRGQLRRLTTERVEAAPVEASPDRAAGAVRAAAATRAQVAPPVPSPQPR